jgi:hypothetical protein
LFIGVGNSDGDDGATMERRPVAVVARVVGVIELEKKMVVEGGGSMAPSGAKLTCLTRDHRRRAREPLPPSLTPSAAGGL